EKYASRLAEWNVVRLEEVEGQRNGREIAVAALIVGVRPMRSKKGARWAIFTIQDMTGVQELLAFPESFTKHEQTLKPGTPLLLKVRVQIEEAGTRLSLQEARRIADVAGTRQRELEKLEKEVDDLKLLAGTEEADAELERLREQVAELRKEFYAHLGPWQRAQIARHPQRPYLTDYIPLLFTDFVELHGDRAFGDDRALIAGLAKFKGRPVAVIGQQKGRDTKQRVIRNFGQPKPEGYRKALRVMQLAAKFGRPILTFVDT